MTDNDTPGNSLEPTTPAAVGDADAPTREVPPSGRRLTRNRKLALVGGAAAVIGLGAIAAPVVANTLDDDGRDHDERHEQFEQELAKKLGVPQEKVDGALKELQGDRLGQRIDELLQSGALSAEQATGIKAKIASGDVEGAMTELRASMMATQLSALVKAGTVTQAQADQIAALVKADVPVGLRTPPPGSSEEQQRPEHVESAEHQQEQVQRLQEAGIISAAQAKEIGALITAGKTAEAETAIHAAMDASLLEQLVQDGKVTQAQADQITALQAAGVPIGIGGPGTGGPGGHHGVDGDRHGKGGDHHDGDHGMGGFDGPPPMDGGSPNGGSQNGGFQPQTYGGDSA